MPATTQRIIGHVWLIDCKQCGRTRARLTADGRPASPTNVFGSPTYGGVCDRCGKATHPARKGKILANDKSTKCGDMCRDAKGYDCLCECLGENHGRRTKPASSHQCKTCGSYVTPKNDGQFGPYCQLCGSHDIEANP